MALTIEGIAPGPQVMTSKPDLFWGLIASMWVGNAMLVILNLPLVGMWVKLLKIPYRYLFRGSIMFARSATDSINSRPMDVYLCGIAGILGYLLVSWSASRAR